LLLYDIQQVVSFKQSTVNSCLPTFVYCKTNNTLSLVFFTQFIPFLTNFVLSTSTPNSIQFMW
jgi:hypothetical protein